MFTKETRKREFFRIAAIVILSAVLTACTPEGIAQETRPAVTQTIEDLDLNGTIELEEGVEIVVETATPENTSTPEATRTPEQTATPKLPVSSYDQLPGKLVSLNAENVDGIQLIGTFGEGLYYSTHFNEDENRFVVVYSTGIDIFQKQNGAFQSVKRLYFDIYDHSDLFHKSWVLGSIHKPYAVSRSTQYYAQNYGDRIKVMNLVNEQTVYIHLREGDNLGWKEFDQKIFFSSQSNYLLIDSLSEQILFDLNSYSELLRVEMLEGESFFSIDEDHLLIADKTENKLEVYALPNGRLVNTINDYNSDEFPLWLTITDDQKLVTVSEKYLSIFNIIDFELLVAENLPFDYSTGKVEIVENKYIIIGFQGLNRGVCVWDLENIENQKCFHGNSDNLFSGQYRLSPNEKFLFIFNDPYGDLLKLGDWEPLITVKEDYKIPIYDAFFTKNAKYFTIVYRAHFRPFIFDIERNDQLEIDIDFGFDIENDKYDENEPTKSFQAITEAFLWVRYSDNNYVKHLIQYDLKSGVKQIHSYINKSGYNTLYSNNEIMINQHLSENKLDIRNLNDFSQLGSDLPYRSRYLGFETGVNSGIDRKNWFHGFQMEDEPFISSIRWNVDKYALKDAMNYILPQGQTPFVRNINSPDGRYRVELISPGISGFTIFDNESDNLIFSRNHLGRIKNFLISNDSELIYIVGLLSSSDETDGFIRVYNINTGELEKIITVSKPPFNQNIGFPMDISLNGNHLVMGNSAGLLEMIDLDNDWQVLYTLDVLGPNSDIQFAPNGSFFAVANVDDRIQLYTTENGAFLAEIEVLGGYGLGDYRLIQYYLTDKMIIAAEYSRPRVGIYYSWGWNGQIKVYGRFDWMK